MLTFDRSAVLFQVAGRPRPKARQRHRIAKTRDGRQYVQNYQPRDGHTAASETAIGWRAREAMKGRAPLQGPLAVILTAVIPMPKAWNKAQRAAALAHDIRPTVKPDGDNILKALDGANKIVWVDDSQIVDARVLKYYGISPFIQVEVFTP